MVCRLSRSISAQQRTAMKLRLKASKQCLAHRYSAPATRFRLGDTMKIPRRQFLRLAAGAAALSVASGIARAQSYPTRPVRIVVGSAAGGTSDILARLMGQWLSERLGQQFVIDNRPGGGSNIGTEAVVRAPPDGYTMLLATAPNAVNPTLYDKLNFNFISEITTASGLVPCP